jgi:hypothetical protein
MHFDAFFFQQFVQQLVGALARLFFLVCDDQDVA